MQNDLIGFNQHAAILNHHLVLNGTLFSSLEIHDDHLQVQTNVNGIPDWEYKLPFIKDYGLDYENNLYVRDTITNPE